MKNFRQHSQTRRLEEEQKSIGGETGTFAFAKGSDEQTFARDSRGPSNVDTPDDQMSLEGRCRFW